MARTVARAIAAIACFSLMALAGPARADPVNLDQWYTFGFDDPGTSLVSGTGFVLGSQSLAAPDPPWTFTCGADGCTLTVTDGFNSGDQFELFDFGALIGQTSVPTAGSNCGNNEPSCLADPDFSHGTFLLAAGDHSITGAALLSPFGGGAAFFRIDAASVPEPGSLLLSALALLSLAALRRRSA